MGYLDWLYYDDRLEEGEKEGCKPLVGFLLAPLHAVQNREETRGHDAEETHCVARAMWNQARAKESKQKSDNLDEHDGANGIETVS
ncbi:hypothetical protein ElyMa_002839000 [Elysia marginata]|uniref:Uncharacterized protein n=1 Tax=Elysia marginata TaxID=1093978 RepID=A0AAV4HTB7_9GAST|nr:hypothetical protein ElyMa_002839000 [Elysia marginata]